MFVLLFLHILLMFTAVAVASGTSILVLLVARRGDQSVVAAITSLPIPRIAPFLYISGGVFGLLTALAFGYNLLAPWLIIAYVLFALFAAFGILYTGPVFMRIHAAVADPQVSGEAFAEAISRFRTDAVVTMAGIALLVADMVFKPFS
jgi:hypothetical protein